MQKIQKLYFAQYWQILKLLYRKKMAHEYKANLLKNQSLNENWNKTKKNSFSVHGNRLLNFLRKNAYSHIINATQQTTIKLGRRTSFICDIFSNLVTFKIFLFCSIQHSLSVSNNFIIFQKVRSKPELIILNVTFSQGFIQTYNHMSQGERLGQCQ